MVTVKEIEMLKARRKILRRQFTTCKGKLINLLSEPARNNISVSAEFERLKLRHESLCATQNALLDLWLQDDDRDEEALQIDIDAADEYESEFFYLQGKVNEAINSAPSNGSPHTVKKAASCCGCSADNNNKNIILKLPKMELPKFDGKIENWLGFWTQFRKIDVDESLDNDCKFQYLLQCMEPGTTAKDVLSTFPPTGENYGRAIEQLKLRFGREDMIIQYYVRELLKLVQTRGVTPINILYDKLMSKILALETLGMTQEKYTAFLFPMVESSIPEDTLRAWNRSRANSNDATLENFLTFLKKEVESEELINLAHSSDRVSVSANTPTAACLAESISKKKPHDRSEKFSKYDSKCLWCDVNTHNSSECTKAVYMSMDQRVEFIKKKKACLICLCVGHRALTCRKHPKCVVCTKRHYPILCNEVLKEVKSGTDSKVNVSNFANSECSVLLQTLKVNITNGGKVATVRALIDSGAQRSFICSDIVSKLGLKSVGTQQLVHNLFGGNVTKKYSHNMFCISVNNLECTYECNLSVLEQNKICRYIPRLNNSRIMSRLQSEGILLSDCCNDDMEISLLIGSDFIGSLLTGRSVLIEGNLLATETRLGLTIQGPTIGVYNCFVNTLNCTFDVEDLWKLETIGIRDDAEVKERCEKNSEVMDFFYNTVKRQSDGRYEVRLPFKETVEYLPTNYNLAVKRLQSTTAKLDKMGIVGQYDTVFKEWEAEGIIEEVANDDSQYGHYLPHHAVVKANNATTKIRPVFDASAAEKCEFSLNSCLEKGINLIELIPKLLIQFRIGTIGIISDIRKAFLMISVNPNDRCYLKFLWWHDVDSAQRRLKTFRHRRVVFGVTTSPFLLAATILHHLEAFKDCSTAATLKNCFYVDNCVTSVDTIEDMTHFMSKAKDIMSKGQFDLRCWVTGPEISDAGVINAPVLGLIWDPKCDTLQVKIPTIDNVNTKITKRYLLSVTQSIFDPLGFICPITIIPKIILQKCWSLKINWDTEIPEQLKHKVRDWIDQLSLLKAYTIPRCLCRSKLSSNNNCIHIFCDASQFAYAACVYLRSECEDSVSVRLILAKARLAPTKSVTIPRLELIAAVMGTRLAAEVKNALDINCSETYWTDSSIVLAWIRRKMGLNTFVNNRVREIVQRTDVENWRHISGTQNPADLPSRGCVSQKLLNSEWQEGPKWLTRPEEEWPVSNPTPDFVEVEKEVRKCCLLDNSVEKFSDRLCYFNKYSMIVRTIGWCLRWLRGRNRSTDITAEEFTDAEIRLMKLLQLEHFGDTGNVAGLSLQTTKNAEGLICVKTRLTLSNEVNSFTYPILLPGKNLFVKRLVRQNHIEYLHAGSQTLINKLREKYWIIGVRRLTKEIVRQCVTCKRYSSKPCAAPEAPLPVDRITCGEPFSVTGIDFAGYLLLRCGKKCWIAVFTCATYRAVHLELCTSLSTEDFLLALRRFLARRGAVKIIYSDNATNFRGASNVLANINWSKVSESSQANKILWRFIPPSAPWWGGFWERMIRTIKGILRRILGKASIYETELTTIIYEVEAVINSRPLTYISDNTEGLVPLTPAMFLGAVRTETQLLDIANAKGVTARWRYLKKLTEDLRQRFRSEYLSLLVHRSPNEGTNTVKEGDVVLIGSDDSKRVDWPLAVVLEVIPGADGHSRVARLRTSTGEKLRAYQRLYPLELNDRDVSLGVDERQVVVTRSGRPVRVPRRLDL